MSNHPNSVAAERTHDRNKARTDRRLICEMVARSGPAGCSDEDLARGIPSIHSNSLRIRRAELTGKLRADGYVGYGFITDELGVMKRSEHDKQVTCWHVTEAGLRALGEDFAGHWHAGKPAEVAP